MNTYEADATNLVTMYNKGEYVDILKFAEWQARTFPQFFRTIIAQATQDAMALDTSPAWAKGLVSQGSEPDTLSIAADCLIGACSKLAYAMATREGFALLDASKVIARGIERSFPSMVKKCGAVRTTQTPKAPKENERSVTALVQNGDKVTTVGFRFTWATTGDIMDVTKESDGIAPSSLNTADTIADLALEDAISTPADNPFLAHDKAEFKAGHENGYREGALSRQVAHGEQVAKVRSHGIARGRKLNKALRRAHAEIAALQAKIVVLETAPKKGTPRPPKANTVANLA